MKYKFDHPLIRPETVVYLNSAIEEINTRRSEQDDYFSRILREQQRRHTIVYTSSELENLRYSQI